MDNVVQLRARSESPFPPDPDSPDPGGLALYIGRRIAQTTAAGYRTWMANDAGRYSPDPLELRDAFNECHHGAVPGDRVKRCACFDAPVAAVQAEPVPIAA